MADDSEHPAKRPYNRRVSEPSDLDACRNAALGFALQAALGKATQFVKAQDVVQDAQKYLAFLEGKTEGEAS